jgi:hypothetical protein
MNAVFRLENPLVQNVDGKLVVVVTFATDAGHSWPPLSHSHAILSFLRDLEQTSLHANVKAHPLCNSTMIMMVRIAQIMIKNGHRNMQTLIRMYDRCHRMSMLEREHGQASTDIRESDSSHHCD